MVPFTPYRRKRDVKGDKALPTGALGGALLGLAEDAAAANGRSFISSPHQGCPDIRQRTQAPVGAATGLGTLAVVLPARALSGSPPFYRQQGLPVSLCGAVRASGQWVASTVPLPF